MTPNLKPWPRNPYMWLIKRVPWMGEKVKNRKRKKTTKKKQKTNVRSWERDLGERQQLLSKHDQTHDLSFLWHDCECCSTSDPVLLSRHVYTSLYLSLSRLSASRCFCLRRRVQAVSLRLASSCCRCTEKLFLHRTSRRGLRNLMKRSQRIRSPEDRILKLITLFLSVFGKHPRAAG